METKLEVAKSKNKKNIVGQDSKINKENSRQINKEKNDSNNKLIAVVRISGMVKVRKEIRDTLDRLRLRRKYACILIDQKNKGLLGMVEKARFYIAYGEIDRETLVRLIKERGKFMNSKKQIKISAEDVADSLIKGKKLNDFNLKPFFRLHPPRKGIKSKLQYPKGVLGNNGKNINKLIERML